MIRGIGNDIIDVSRIAAGIERYGDRFLNRIFTAQEQEYCLRYQGASAVHFAGRFCAKEAIAKALGVGISDSLSWQDMEVLNDAKGRPCVHLSSQANLYFNNPNILITISHCVQYAVATAICFD